MSTISNATYETVQLLRQKVATAIAGRASLEEAAQIFTDVFFGEFSESIVLVRFFATVPFGNLPSSNQTFVNNLATSHGIVPLINDETLVLSLLGTRGKKSTWNSRHDSEGHVGIPLASADFIDSIPMMSRLLKELGISVGWINNLDTEIVAKTIGRMGGVFYVPDATTAVDNRGRKIITAQNFVVENCIKTVFGFGGGYMMKSICPAFIMIIIFTREMVQKPVAKEFMVLANVIKTATVGLAAKGLIFTQSGPKAGPGV